MNQKKYIIGVDEGSQSAKILIFDLEGNVVCEGKENLRPYDLPKPGIVEHPEDDWWDAICVASKKAMANFKGEVKDIIGVGLCTIRYCRSFLKEDGRLAQPGLSWMDVRVSKPYEPVNPEVRYVTTSSGYITHRFTGEFKDTAANYQGMWPIDTDTWQWMEPGESFDYYGIPREMLFELVMPGESLGCVTKEASEATGIPCGLPVIATANDKAVEALGVGCTGKHTALVSLGTYITAMTQGYDNPKNTVSFWTNFASTPLNYLYESGGIRRGMWTISWFKEVMGESYEEKAKSLGMSAEEFLSMEAKAAPPGSDGLLTVLDWLAPTDKLYKKGLMIGFDGRHGRAHMYRSILEGIAMTMKANVDEMCKERQMNLEEIIISGGGSNSELFMQIFADTFGIPAKRNVVNGAAGLGAAICAAVAVGAYPDFDSAVEKMVKVKDVFEPDLKNHEMYKKLTEIHKQITTYTDPILEKTYEIFS
ncbi:MAG: FGGY-family carbohydrate kinase [Eubacteriaceae bacterium]